MGRADAPAVAIQPARPAPTRPHKAARPGPPTSRPDLDRQIGAYLMITPTDLGDAARALNAADETSTITAYYEAGSKLVRLVLAYEAQDAKQLADMQADADGVERIMAAVRSQEDLERALAEAIYAARRRARFLDDPDDLDGHLARAVLPIVTAYADQRATRPWDDAMTGELRDALVPEIEWEAGQ